MDMIHQLIAAEADRSLLKRRHHYSSPDLLVIDELAYLPLGVQGSNLLFQVISARHGLRSTMITTSLPFTDWGKIFDSTTVATAIADRLVFNSEILVLEGESYRKRTRKSS
jgi:DNA replication protein DnaC